MKRKQRELKMAIAAIRKQYFQIKSHYSNLPFLQPHHILKCGDPEVMTRSVGNWSALIMFMEEGRVFRWSVTPEDVATLLIWASVKCGCCLTDAQRVTFQEKNLLPNDEEMLKTCKCDTISDVYDLAGIPPAICWPCQRNAYAIPRRPVLHARA